MVDLNKYLPGLKALTINPHELKQGSIIVAAPIGAVADSTTRTGILPVIRGLTVARIVLANRGATPASAGGVITLEVGNRDGGSGGADDTLLSTATINLESVPGANETLELTLTATAADLVLASGDHIYAEVVSDNADATGLDGLSLLIELTVDQP